MARSMSSRYRELTGKVDAFFARVHARHAADMRCAAGCDQCCRARLSITGVEAAAIAEHVAAMAPEARARLGEIARRPAATAAGVRCAALDDDGRCGVYEARPLVCRSHGVPIRMRVEDGGPERADADCILDQETLSAMLAAVDSEDADARGRGRGERVELAALLVELTG
jgi:uncharacterized protein